MTKRKFKAGALIVAGAITAGASVAYAQPIAITNNSFETINSSNQPVGFTITGGVGVNASSPNYAGIVTNSGDYYVGTSPNYGTPSLSQTTNATASAGDTYNLSVEIANIVGNGRNATAADYVGSLELVIGNVVVSNPLATTETPQTGNFDSTESLTYTATAADAGETIGVELIGPTTIGVNFDDLELNVTPAGTESIPEPSTWAMLAAGFIALLTLGRVRHKA